MRLLVIGHATALDQACAALGHPAFPRAEADSVFPPLSLLPAGAEQAPVATGRISPEAGRFSFLAVDQAVRLALAGRIAAIVTAPLNKEALNLAGYKYAGHTDMLADLTGRKTSVMMLAHGNMRVSHVTTHVALEKVPALVTPERVRRTIDLTHDALRRMGIARPHIAVAALNPHAGEGGLFGTQDNDVTAPVVAQCNAEGMHVSGPVPGDTVFVKLRGGQYDAVVAMYHDQGHIPVKLLGFQMNPATGTFDSLSGVNITLGLPVIRTSVDHGTAFDIAGRGIANADSMVEAIEVALQMTAAEGASA
jgi:4-hydroxythreonine-4-phosphate dehydrogenase